MNPTDKKTAVLAASEESQDTEAILLERLKSSSNSNEYFRWMLFVVGFYRGINNIDAATDLLEGFIKAGNDAEQTAHCYLALGQIATDEQRLEDALNCFTLALEHAPKRKKVAYVLHNNIGFCLTAWSVMAREKHTAAKPSKSTGRAPADIATSESASKVREILTPQRGLWSKRFAPIQPMNELGRFCKS